MYVAVTDGVKIQVEPTFMPEHTDPVKHRWLWSYKVTITNESNTPVRLLTRHWIITDANGATEEVEGVGVIGETPEIAPGESHAYRSYCPLHTTFGSMHGTYGMVREDGTALNAEIPRFNLVAPEAIN